MDGTTLTTNIPQSLRQTDILNMGIISNFNFMIKATELRIGNWIMVAGTGELHPAQINIDNLRQLLVAPEYGAAIPLTPEILESCGFEKVFYGWKIDKTLFELSYDYTPLLNEGEYSIGVELQFLHQLQNFYFAYTGEELEVNFTNSLN